jgi:tetratricopeptide (TPR) repeat protein
VRYALERGRVFNSSGQKEKASALFREAYDLALAYSEDFYAVDAAHMLGISEPPEHQLNWSLKALELAERSSDPRAQKWRGALYNNIGWSYHDQGDYQTALELFQRALEWRQAQGQARETRIARWCVARTLRSVNRLAEALQVQEELLTECERLGEPDGYVYEELGEILLALQHAEAARPHFARAYDLLSQDPWLAANEPGRLERLRTLGQGA